MVGLPYIFYKIKNERNSLNNLLNGNGDISFDKIYPWLNEFGGFDSEYIAFWYEEDESCLICRAEFGLENIDSAYWGVPGWNYMFGCSINNGIISPNYNGILCYDSADTLVFLKNVLRQ